MFRRVQIMSLKSQESPKSQARIPTLKEVWQTLDRVGQRLDRVAKQQEKAQKLSTQRAIEFQKEMKQRQKEAEQRQKKEAEKQKKEAERQKKEAEKQKKEAEQRQKEAEKLSAKWAAEFKEEMRQHRIENDRQLNKFRGMWGNAWGDFVESLVSGRFVELIQTWIPSINQLGKNQTSQRGEHACEFDLIAINTDSLVATEVKSTLTVKDVRRFLEKLKHFTLFFPQYKGYKIYGAVAYLKANEDAQKFAMKHGLFVICATGDSSKILNKKESFIPRIIDQAPQFPTDSIVE